MDRIIDLLEMAIEASTESDRSYWLSAVEERTPRLEFTGHYLMVLWRDEDRHPEFFRILSEYGL